MSVNTFRLKSNVDVTQRPKHFDLLVQGRLCSSFCDFTPFLQHTLRHLAASNQMDISHARRRSTVFATEWNVPKSLKKLLWSSHTMF